MCSPWPCKIELYNALSNPRHLYGQEWAAVRGADSFWAQQRVADNSNCCHARRPPRRFKVASKLGQGAFADVLCVKDAARSQQLAALKVLKPVPAPLPPGLAVPGALVQRASSFNSPGAQAPEVSLFREARALKHSKHP